MRRRARLGFSYFAIFAMAAPLLIGGALGCGSASASHAADDFATAGTSVEIGELEIHGDGLDRFATCPPPGELGQRWIPDIPPWTPPPPSAAPAEAPSPDAPPAPAMNWQDNTPTEHAMSETLQPYRSCYRRGLVHDPTQDGHAAMVARVGPDGKVAKVEVYAACELSSEVLTCMADATRKVRFAPPATGGETVIIPSVHASRGARLARPPSASDPYTVEAYLTVEAARPALHACEARARQGSHPVEAAGTFRLLIGPRGKVIDQRIDPWVGSQDLLACAAHAFDDVVFRPPPGGRGVVHVRIDFNPRVGSR